MAVCSGIPFHSAPIPHPKKPKKNFLFFGGGGGDRSSRLSQRANKPPYMSVGIHVRPIPIKEQVISEHLLNHQSWHVHHVVHFGNDTLAGVENSKLVMVL